MSEKPIIFSGESVLAILAGRKTQTRRIFWSRDGSKRVLPSVVTPIATGVEWWAEPFGWNKCPYGFPGDRLWVRETWRGGGGPVGAPPHYRADPDEVSGGPWCSPIYMPRWASRLTLEITEVRVQRLQEISAEDIAAEMGWLPCDRGGECACARDMFRPVWDRLNGKRAPWDSNPWVWAITFRREA